MKTDPITWDINCNPNNLNNGEPFDVQITSNEHFLVDSHSVAPSSDTPLTYHIFVHCHTDFTSASSQSEFPSGLVIDDSPLGHDVFIYLFASESDEKPVKVIKSKTKVTDPLEEKK